ncbi:DUF6438 domain-containing protein [Sphingomonas sp. HF-S3]|uniref:DUF6438 domain-containing protein n=1 Tax=Sphingomonas rustica TaxID=3103142 RepID=A0ABV0BBQ1_9SPHN
MRGFRTAALAALILLLSGCGDDVPAKRGRQRPMPGGVATGAPSPVSLPTSLASPAPAGPRFDPSSIEIGYGPCEGQCPVFTITLFADGRGIFDGKGAGPFTDMDTTTLVGSRTFKVSPQTYREVVAALEPVRPSGRRMIVENEPGECADHIPDGASRSIAWAGEAGRSDALHWATGCVEPRYAPIQRSINSALAKLPVIEWIGLTRRSSAIE